jgi:leader peptidase (prepilin peptidase) / N-methyltransferase
MVAGFVCSFLLAVPQGQAALGTALRQSLLGMAAGGGIIYFILRGGKLVFGRQRMTLPTDTRIIFSETAVHLPEGEIPYEDLFYRQSDVISLQARTVELVDRCYKDVRVRLSPAKLKIGEEEMDPEQVPYLEAVSTEIVLPREAMGLGDVKFMAAIGAFLGWKAVVFSLILSSFIGGILVGLPLVLLGRRELSSRLPYGPYIALAAAIWIFEGRPIVTLFFRCMNWMNSLLFGR